MVGRGSTDDKGPLLGWLNVLQYHHENKKPLPVNLRFCFEGMEEVGGEQLDEVVVRESKPGGWFDGVDCVCIVSVVVLLTLHLTLLSSRITTGSTRQHLF